MGDVEKCEESSRKVFQNCVDNNNMKDANDKGELDKTNKVKVTPCTLNHRNHDIHSKTIDNPKNGNENTV
eukprot:875553-Ditylum_brightwellii.AAC.1